MDQAQNVIDRCRDLSQRNGLGRWATEAAREQAEILAAQDDFRSAFEACRNFHEQTVAQGASENEAKGRILEAMFQTAESRRESERYRELAERDPLTGLHNRRHGDDQFGVALAPDDGRESSDLLRTADLRLCVAKRDGRNRVVNCATIASSSADATSPLPEAIAVG